MKLTQQRQIDRFSRSLTFLDNHASEFAPGSKALKFGTSLQDLVNKLEGIHGSKKDESSTGKASRNSLKRDTLNAMREDLAIVEDTAAAIASLEPGFHNTFVVSDWRRKDELVANAKQFISDVQKAKGQFLEFEMSDDFVDRLQEKLDAYLALENAKVPIGQGSGETEDVSTLINEGERLAGFLNVVMANKYRDNVEVLKEWREASSLEITPRKKGK